MDIRIRLMCMVPFHLVLGLYIQGCSQHQFPWQSKTMGCKRLVCSHAQYSRCAQWHRVVHTHAQAQATHTVHFRMRKYKTGHVSGCNMKMYLGLRGRRAAETARYNRSKMFLGESGERRNTE